MTSVTVTIANKKGLHARAAAKFVTVVAGHKAKINVAKDGADAVSGSSILGLMMLGADKGTKLILSAEGPDAEQALASLKELVEGRFGEPE